MATMSLDAGLDDWRSAEESGGTGTYDIKILLQQLKNAHERPMQAETAKNEALPEDGRSSGFNELDAGLDEWRAAEERARESSLRKTLAQERKLETHIVSLVEMGFTREQAKSALQAKGGNVDSALQMLLEPNTTEANSNSGDAVATTDESNTRSKTGAASAPKKKKRGGGRHNTVGASKAKADVIAPESQGVAKKQTARNRSQAKNRKERDGLEKRQAPDGSGAYTRREFIKFYGGTAEWDAAPSGSETKFERDRRQVAEAQERAAIAAAVRAVEAFEAAEAAAAPRRLARAKLRAALVRFAAQGNGRALKKAISDNSFKALRIVECCFARDDDDDAAHLNLGGDDAGMEAAGEMLCKFINIMGTSAVKLHNVVNDLAFVANDHQSAVNVAPSTEAKNLMKRTRGGRRHSKSPARTPKTVVFAPMDIERTTANRRGALVAMRTLIATHGPHMMMYLLPALPQLVAACSDKDKHVRTLAEECSLALVDALPANATEFALHFLVPTLNMKWQSQVKTLSLIDSLADRAPRQLERCMPTLIPQLTGLINDTKENVRGAARVTMANVCDKLQNDDVRPFIPVLIDCLIDPSNLTEVIHSLAGTTFVEVLTAPTLSVVMPILLRGLRDRFAATKRLCGVIVENLVKLVESPDEVKDFISALIAPIKIAHEGTSIPEARETLKMIQKKLEDIASSGNNIIKEGNSLFSINSQTLGKLAAPGKDDETSVYAANIILTNFFNGCNKASQVAHDLAFLGNKAATAGARACLKKYGRLIKVVAQEEDGGDDELCNCTFTLAYGTKVLLRNVSMRLKRNHHYGLLGPNDCGKTTLLRSIANEQVDGFPPQSELKAVFVESDIQGEQSHLSCIDYILEDPQIKALGARITHNVVRDTLVKVGFSLELLPSGGWVDAATSTLSGGWRMKLALARAMLQDADVLLMDEPTNHLDVLNVAWVTKYLQSLENKTTIIVSHDAGFMNNVCGSILEITRSMKLKLFTGSGQGSVLNEFVAENPHARSFFELTASTQEFHFPKPGAIDGVSSKGKPLMTMNNCTFTYPGNARPTVFDITVKVSLSSRVACVGQNGAGKSTMIKLLTFEQAPQTGEVWKHPCARIAYVAQHAFHHIEEHLTKTPVQYLLWRYHGNMDKESIAKPTMELTEEEEKLQKAPFEFQWKDTETGKVMKAKRTIGELTGGRLLDKKRGGYEYEVKWVGMTHSQNSYLSATKLKKQGFAKAMRLVDEEIALAEGMFHNPLTASNVEKFFEGFGLEPEFASHTRIGALSDGQKVKVVLGGSFWNQPHIVILDEPTNYLDRDSLGALSKAIEKFDGGVVMITHNDEFCKHLCPERWVLEAGRLDCQGDAEWMANALSQQVEVEQVNAVRKDAAGNEVKISAVKRLTGKELKKRIALVKKKMSEGEELDSEDEEIAYAHDIGV